MAIALPIGIKERLVGTGFVAGAQEDMLAIVTALHLIGNGQEFRIGIPPHLGDLSSHQPYPLSNIVAVEARLALVEPLLDLAVLLVNDKRLRAPIPRFISSPSVVRVGEEVMVVGYPFAAIGSFLETVEPCHISAIGKRLLSNDVGRIEFIISHQTYSGSSGSPVVRKSDGSVCGIVRGCLSPPGVISIGSLPVGTDTNVTYVASAHVIPNLVSEAFQTEKWA